MVGWAKEGPGMVHEAAVPPPDPLRAVAGRRTRLTLGRRRAWGVPGTAAAHPSSLTKFTCLGNKGEIRWERKGMNGNKE